jgi:hypothetical protein
MFGTTPEVDTVIRRRAHPHEDDVGDEAAAVAGDVDAGRGRKAREVAEPLAGDDQLADDLGRRQVADELLRAGVAELAGQRAADLARDAERAAPLLGDVDGLDLGAAIVRAGRRQPQQPFARAVDRDLLGDDLGPRQRTGRRERGPQLLADIGHRREIGAAAMIDPVPELAGAHPHLRRRHADGSERIAELRTRQADERRAWSADRRSRSGQGMGDGRVHIEAERWEAGCRLRAGIRIKGTPGTLCRAPPRCPRGNRCRW